jgi:hypothetical protein
MRKPVLIAGAIPLLLAAVPAWAQLDADDTQVVRGRGPATSARLGDNSGANVGRSENSTTANGNPSGSRPSGPNGNPAGSNVRRDAGPNHAVDGRGNIDATFGTVNGVGALNDAGGTLEPLTSGSANEANAAIVRPRDRVNGNPSGGRPAKPTPGTANNPLGSFTPGFNGNANEAGNLSDSGGNENRRGGNSADTGLLNTVRSRNENGGGAFGGDNSILGGYGNSVGAEGPGTGPEWNGNDPDTADNDTAARRPRQQDSGSGSPNSRDRQGASNSGPQGAAGNRNDKDESSTKSSGSEEEKQQDRNSGGSSQGDGGDGGGSENDNKPSAQGSGTPDRPEEDQYGSGNPFARALAGRRAGEIVGRGLGRDVTGEHRDEERQDNEDAGAMIGGRRNILTGERAVTAPGNKGPSPLLRKIVKDAQERKKNQ